ncbi:MAG: glycosyl transferase group 1 [Solirubrobacterales bacterium]|nr:glycosyl transferase group 1 [Solirubrobacterales bacterium]
MTQAPRVGIVCSRFPKLSETFILDELVALERHGVDVVPMPLHLEHRGPRHPDADRFVRRAMAARPWSRHTLRAQLHWLRRSPRAYLSAWVGALRGTVRSPGFFLRTFLVVPLGARIALDAQARGVTRLHAHYATHPALACWVASRLTGLPWSMTVHAHDITVDTTMLAEKARDAEFVVAIGEGNAGVVRDVAGEDATIHVVHCGVDLRRLVPRTSEPRGPADPFVLCCVASLEEYKGHEHLLRAVALLADSGIDVQLRLVGSGDREHALRRLAARLGILGRVTFLGPLDRDAVAGELHRAHAFVLASVVTRSGKCEGIPVALMEAMACGLPVLATTVGGVAELVDNWRNGLLVAPGDPGALERGLRRLAGEDALAARLGTAARATVATHFDRNRETARLARLLTRGSALGDEQREDPVHVHGPVMSRG